MLIPTGMTRQRQNSDLRTTVLQLSTCGKNLTELLTDICERYQKVALGSAFILKIRNALKPIVI